MTLIQVFDRLTNGQRVNRIDFKDDGYVLCPHPALVKYAQDCEGEFEDISIGLDEWGLSIHFNVNWNGGKVGEEQSLTNIVSVR